MSDEVIPDGYLEVHFGNPDWPHYTFYLNEVETWWWSRCGPHMSGHDHSVERLIVRSLSGHRAEIPASNIRELKVVPNTKATEVK